MTLCTQHAAAIAHAESVCRAIAPLDLADFPVYVALASEAPENLRSPGECRAWTSTHLDLWLEDSLRSSDRWQGRGHAMLMQIAPEDTDFLSVVVHELAHRLETPREDNVLALCEREIIPATHRHLVEAPAKLSFDRPKRWGSHEWQFIRCCIHLSWRAKQAGVEVHPRAAGLIYGLSPLSHYRAALGNEPETYSGRICDLGSIEPPDDFLFLWEDDTSIEANGVPLEQRVDEILNVADGMTPAAVRELCGVLMRPAPPDLMTGVWDVGRFTSYIRGLPVNAA